jgi:hypothetical protein
MLARQGSLKCSRQRIKCESVPRGTFYDFRSCQPEADRDHVSGFPTLTLAMALIRELSGWIGQELTAVFPLVSLGGSTGEN